MGMNTNARDALHRLHGPDGRHGRNTLDAEAGRIADGLEQATLPRAEWTHRAHVLAATALVRRHGGAEALARLRLAIPRYNEATGTANTDTSGYHDTLTVFYTWAIERLVDRRPVDTRHPLAPADEPDGAPVVVGPRDAVLPRGPTQLRSLDARAPGRSRRPRTSSSAIRLALTG